VQIITEYIENAQRHQNQYINSNQFTINKCVHFDYAYKWAKWVGT